MPEKQITRRLATNVFDAGVTSASLTGGNLFRPCLRMARWLSEAPIDRDCDEASARLPGALVVRGCRTARHAGPLLGALAALTLCVPVATAAQDRPAPLKLLARIGPWPSVSKLIGYRGRLWFTNSVKWKDHNSADLHSYDPAAGDVRYEAHLFSQDAGDPTVHKGLLYWPFEDPRSSMSRGEFMVTNGRAWQWRFLPRLRAFHTHAVASHEGGLYAATSSWRAGLQRSRDGGRRWTMLHRHDNPSSRISRIVALTSHGEALYAGLFARYRTAPSLLRLEDGKLTPVPGWPPGRGALPLASWRGHLYASNADKAGRSFWRSDGARHERIAGLDGYFVRDVAGGPNALWAITAHRNSGYLWRSTNGSAWRRVQEFEGAQPLDVAVFEGRPYVGTTGPGKRGGLWGTDKRRAPRVLPAPPTLPVYAGRPLGRPLAAVLAELDRLMANATSHRNYRKHEGRIEALLRELAASRSPAVGRALAARLARRYPTAVLKLFGSRVQVPFDRLARWYFLWAMAMNGHGRVPHRFLEEPWTTRANGAEKYLEDPPAAAWAVARLGQSDPATVKSLVRRLGRAGDPPWLEGDMIGALTVLTGKRFGYDRARWRRWWAARR